MKTKKTSHVPSTLRALSPASLAAVGGGDRWHIVKRLTVVPGLSEPIWMDGLVYG
jgi:hypothetical protein